MLLLLLLLLLSLLSQAKVKSTPSPQTGVPQKIMKLVDKLEELRASKDQLGVIRINHGPVRDLLEYPEGDFRTTFCFSNISRP